MTKQAASDIESWEKKDAQIRLERAEEFSKLPPEEQEKILAEEKIKFHKAQQKLKQDLGYGDFDPGHQGSEDKKREDRERKEQADALEDLEDEMDTNIEAPSKAEKQTELETAEQKRFEALFQAAEENIEQQKDFQFTSAALDDFGRQIKQSAYMRKIVDHSQQKALNSREVWARLQKGESRPNQIGVVIEIDMGEDQNNSLGLTNLRLELSLASLLDGHFSEKLSRFTNLVLYAAVMHARQKQQSSVPVMQDDREGSPAGNERINTELSERGVSQIGENGGLDMAKGIFESGRTGTVAFSFNNGAVWGTFEEHGAPNNPKELQESLDKTNIDK